MEQIFVSSVQKELQTERYAVRDFVHSNELLRQFFRVFLFEDLPPADRRADGVYLEEVARSPIYVGCVFLDLLLAMGYGGWREEAPRMTKTTNDEAIDGVSTKTASASTSFASKPNVGRTPSAARESKVLFV